MANASFVATNGNRIRRGFALSSAVVNVFNPVPMDEVDDNTVHDGATGASGTLEELSSSGRPTRVRTPKLCRICDGVTEGLIYFGVVFTPWAFGTTQNWSIWTMNVVCYLLGGALITKWVVRWWTGYRPERWGDCLGDGSWEMGVGEEDQRPRTRDQGGEASSPWSVVRSLTMGRILTRALAGLTVLILAYCLISAVNARARFVWEELRFDYFENYIPWLPHSYDSGSTWNVFWQYLGLAFFFWATRDWLLGKTNRERREAGGQLSVVSDQMSIGEGEDQGLEFSTQGAVVSSRVERGLEADIRDPGCASAGTPCFADRLRRDSRSHGRVLPTRLRRLLWILCINGGLLALEGILQRLDGTNKLLWLVVPRFNNVTDGQFGPYAYRSNAATYYNLVWPVCIGLWLVLRKASTGTSTSRGRFGGGSHTLLLPCTVIIASAPIVSSGRGGALVALAMIPAASGIVLFSTRGEASWIRAAMLSVFIVILAFAGHLGWKQLAERLENVFVDNLNNRTRIYENARPIAEQFPIFGTGPGTFAVVYRLYKQPNQEWVAYVHDDWLETRITFGRAGFAVILLMLGTLFAGCFFRRAICSGWPFAYCILLAMSGCLIHARFDFPFQIYSIVFVFLLLSSVLFCVTRKCAD